MRDGFVKVAARTPEVRVADVAYNLEHCVAEARDAAMEDGARVVVLPELALTGATCGDLFWQDALLDAALQALFDFAEQTADLDALVVVGVPWRVRGRLYNCAAAVCAGEILALVPEACPRVRAAAASARHFAPAPESYEFVDLGQEELVPFGTQVLFHCSSMPDLVVALEVGSDARALVPPSVAAAAAGATLVLRLAADDARADSARRIAADLSAHTARLGIACAYACSGWGESTTDYVFAGQDLIFERGELLAESRAFSSGAATSEIDVAAIVADRLCDPDAPQIADLASADEFLEVPFAISRAHTELTRAIDPAPFIPADPSARAERAEEILGIQAAGLARRLEHTHSATAVIGISGGLDSTLALLVTTRAFDLLGLDHQGIIAVTMPGFGTTARTKNNACLLAETLGTQVREVSIAAAVRQHFADIGHDEADRDATYENAQARERTQVLMDLANQEGGLVIGTGDLSELALGWATFNGDHMAMYGVNADVPKTLIRHLVAHVAATCGNDTEAQVLADVLATPVSPELLPPTESGTIAQQTEDLVGPYELHDFFLYHVVRHGFTPAKIYRLACAAFTGEHAVRETTGDVAMGDAANQGDVASGASGVLATSTYDAATILHWLRVFYRRFFSQQFKRSCMPDGPAVGSVGLSPRGGLAMPSDAASALWLAELDALGA